MDPAADRGQHIAAPAAPAEPSSSAAADTTGPASPDAEARRQAALVRAAHALKTPLAVIKGSATTLLANDGQWDVATQLDLLQLIDAQADRLHQHLNALLEIWRIEAAQLPVRLVPARLDGILEALAAHWKAATPTQAIHLALPPDLPPVPVDAERLNQALDLIVRGALRAAPAPIRFEARAASAEISLTIATQIHPRAPDELTLLFEPLASASDDRPEDHAGLGLARAIIHAHGGQLTAELPPQGNGVVFRIVLPLSVPERAGPPPATAGQSAPAIPGQRPRPGRPRPVILLAGHPAHLARYLRAHLEDAGYRPLVAPDMRQVARLLDMEDPDLVVVDAGLADASGLQALDRLTSAGTGSAPVIVLGAGAEAECVRALDAGAVDYLAQPFGLPELLARLRVALRTAQAAHSEPAEPVFLTGELSIDFAQRAVRMGERSVSLSRTEYKLLRMLAQHVGRVLAHELLLERVWGPAYGQEVEFLWVYVRRLRRKLEPDPRHPRYILTIPGVGYRLAQLPTP